MPRREVVNTDSRAHKRLQGHPERHVVYRCEQSPHSSQEDWSSVIELSDVTLAGACLILDEKLHCENAIYLGFQDEHYDRDVQMSGKVKHVEPHESGTFRVGVSFDQPLSPHELRILSRLGER